MRVRKAGKGQVFRCGAGHYYPDALLVEGQEPPHLNGTYCLVCFGGRVIGRLAVPRADLIADPFGPAEAEPEQEQDTPPAAEEESVERAEEVPEGQEADAGGEPFADPSTGDPGQPGQEGAGEEPAD